ncbi:MAG TPA: hypothetical protein VIU15_06680 [Streptomyces sp.]
MTKTILPGDPKGRAALEAGADKILKEVPEESWGSWPSRFIPCEHDLATDVLCPEEDNFREVRLLMEQGSGGDEPGQYGEILRMHYGGDSVPAPEYGSGFTVERRSDPPEVCRWPDCSEPLYAPEKPRKAGKPRKYCQAHRKAAKAHTERLRYQGIHVGKHRNMSYRDTSAVAVPADRAVWRKGARTPVGGRCTDQFQQNRDVWEGANLPR